MNIVHFSAGRVNPLFAKVGSVNVIYWLALEQERLGHSVTVVVIPDRAKYPNAVAPGFEIMEFPRAMALRLRLSGQLERRILEGHLRIDIAHLHGVYVPEMVAVARLLRRLGIPYVVSAHGSLSPLILARGDRLRKFVFRLLFTKRYLKGAAFLHIHAQGEVNDARAFGVWSPLVLAEHGFDWASIPFGQINANWLSERFPEHARSFKLVFLGRLDPWTKGIDVLLEGLRRVAGTSLGDLALFLIGPPKRRYRRVLPALVKKLRLSDRVVFVGPLYDPVEKFSALASADLFALTSRFEGFPLVLLEAMASGKPLLVTPGTNATAMVAAHRIGWVCDLDPADIARGLLDAFRRRDELPSMGEAAKEAVRQMTWRHAAERLVAAYTSAVSGGTIEPAAI